MSAPFTQRARTALCSLILFLSLVVTGLAQENPRVVDIEVTGNRVATTSLILGSAAIDKGSPLNPTQIQEAIRRLYALGIFSDVSIEGEEVSGGLKLFIVVSELPKLASVELKGNKKISEKDLREKLGLVVGGYISPYLVHKSKEKILDLYADKGYFRAEVKPSLTYSADSTEAYLTFDINEKSKVKVEQVIMTGNQQVPANDLIKKMRNRKRGFLKSSDFAQDKYKEDLDKVIAEYHKRGFIDAYLVSDSTVIDSAINRMTIYLDVYEGPRYYFGETKFAGSEALKEKELRDLLEHKSGEVFNAETYDKSLSELYTAYQDIGHLHVRIDDQRITRDSIIDISYDIVEGLPSHVNMVKIVGNTKTKDRVIRREISMLPGQVFNRSLLIRSVRDVMALNFFSNVEPVPLGLPNGDVDLEFKVDEKQTGQISAGAGYNSQDKLVGSVGMGIPNLAGNGQSLNFNIDFGSRRSSFSVSFTEPWLFGRPTLLGSELYLSNRRWYDDYTEGRQGGSIRLGRRLTWPDNYTRVFASYRLERNKFFDYDDRFVTANSFKTISVYDANNNDIYDGTSVDVPFDTTTWDPYPGSVVSYNEEWNTASRLSLTLSRNSRNLPEFATKGSDISYTIEHTGGVLGGFWNYQKHRVSLAKFIPLLGDIAIAAKVELGAIRAPEGDNKVLVSDRFNPGGVAYDGIVRGYEDGSLTPDSLVTSSDTLLFYTDTTGAGTYQTLKGDPFRTRVRGKYMIVTNIELQVPIAKQSIYGLLFFDAGNSWLTKNDVDPFHGVGLYKSVGVGFRVLVPGIGTIGFDFGYPLDRIRDQSKNWKPHFQIGTTFR